MDTVIQRYYQYQINDNDLLEAIEDATEEWHHGGGGVSLCEYIGMCKPEYNLWIHSPSKFLTLIQAQKNATSLGYADD
jgi:hypothetical protein